MTKLDGTQGDGGAATDTPERFVPDTMRGRLVEAEHMARYLWAAGLCSGRRTLDVGCGAGYGAEILNQAGAAEVVAIDRSTTALDLARTHVTSGVVCQLGDATALDFPDDCFDLVVCFELIEHVDDQTAVMDELARVLRPDGLLLISSPNRLRYVPGNPHHRHELTRAELQGMLDARFTSSRVLSQHVMLASVVGWAQEPSQNAAPLRRLVALDEDEEIYLVAMAGAELPPDPESHVCLTRFAEPRAWLEHIENQRQHIEAMSRHQQVLEGREADYQQALQRLADVEGRFAEVTAARTMLEAELRALQSAHERATARMIDEAAQAAKLAAVLDSRSWRLTGPLRRAGSRLRDR